MGRKSNISMKIPILKISARGGSAFGGKNLNKGLGMVEMIVVIAVILVTFTSILQLFRFQIRAEYSKREELKAYALLAESIEAVRSVRDDGWSNLSLLIIGADYYPVILSGAWALSTNDPGPFDGYSRWIVLSSVLRDANDNIVSAGGTIDEGTLQISAYTEWQSGGDTKTKSLTTYLTNWREKLQ